MKSLLSELRDTIEMLYAIELLDYHDRNHLAKGTDPAKLSRDKQNLLLRAQSITAALNLNQEDKQ